VQHERRVFHRKKLTCFTRLKVVDKLREVYEYLDEKLEHTDYLSTTPGMPDALLYEHVALALVSPCFALRQLLNSQTNLLTFFHKVNNRYDRTCLLNGLTKRFVLDARRYFNFFVTREAVCDGLLHSWEVCKR
jgi:hypothetical protein